MRKIKYRDQWIAAKRKAKSFLICSTYEGYLSEMGIRHNEFIQNELSFYMMEFFKRGIRAGSKSNAKTQSTRRRYRATWFYFEVACLGRLSLFFNFQNTSSGLVPEVFFCVYNSMEFDHNSAELCLNSVELFLNHSRIKTTIPNPSLYTSSMLEACLSNASEMPCLVWSALVLLIDQAWPFFNKKTKPHPRFCLTKCGTYV